MGSLGIRFGSGDLSLGLRLELALSTSSCVLRFGMPAFSSRQCSGRLFQPRLLVPRIKLNQQLPFYHMLVIFNRDSGHITSQFRAHLNDR